jgi:hypothetical protein
MFVERKFRFKTLRHLMIHFWNINSNCNFHASSIWFLTKFLIIHGVFHFSISCLFVLRRNETGDKIRRRSHSGPESNVAQGFGRDPAGWVCCQQETQDVGWVSSCQFCAVYWSELAEVRLKHWGWPREGSYFRERLSKGNIFVSSLLHCEHYLFHGIHLRLLITAEMRTHTKYTFLILLTENLLCFNLRYEETF